MPRIRFQVTGRVQGVGFRARTEACARALGLAGHVQNAADGSVIGAAEGDEAALAAFVAWLRQGPPWSRVDAVEAVAEPPRGEPLPFRIERG